MNITKFYFGGEGRLSRSVFWLTLLGATLLGCPLTVQALSGVLREYLSFLGVVLVVLLEVAVFWIWLAALIRRWHDRDKSGWMVLVCLIPIIGAIWTLIECGFKRGTEGENRFGGDPLADRDLVQRIALSLRFSVVCAGVSAVFLVWYWHGRVAAIVTAIIAAAAVAFVFYRASQFLGKMFSTEKPVT